MHLDPALQLRLVMKPEAEIVLPLPAFGGRLWGKYLKVWFDLTTLS